MTKGRRRRASRLRCASGRCGWCWSSGGEHASQWAAIGSIAAQDRLHGRDAAQVGAAGRARPRAAAGPTTEERERIKALERENRELRQANEILRKASAYFAQAELDRRSKP